MDNNGRYYGKYRGTVVNNIDPMQMGRLTVQVPDVKGLIPSTWAMPCFPISGKQMGSYMIPQVGAGVWVEFEQGDPDFPIWSGCWYGSVAEVPAVALAGIPISPNIVIQTAAQNAIVLSDVPPAPPPQVLPPATPVPGGITLRSTTGAYIVVNDAGIFISSGKGATIMMVGPTITINNGALTIV
jgi:Type VI secretion system/phage-baseplate injector OB domain